jgi:hypothetical protein
LKGVTVPSITGGISFKTIKGDVILAEAEEAGETGEAVPQASSQPNPGLMFVSRACGVYFGPI